MCKICYLEVIFLHKGPFSRFHISNFQFKYIAIFKWSIYDVYLRISLDNKVQKNYPAERYLKQ